MVGWALCGAVVGIGVQFLSMETTLLIHAAAVPVIFGMLSLILCRCLGASSPLQAAAIFLSVVIALDFFVVSHWARCRLCCASFTGSSNRTGGSCL